jgi:hypothetical protein
MACLCSRGFREAGADECPRAVGSAVVPYLK